MATLQFKVRLDEDLHSAIKQAAEKNNRSVNAEIVYRLQQSIETDNTDTPTDDLSRDKLLKALNEMIKHLEEDK